MTFKSYYLNNVANDQVIGSDLVGLTLQQDGQQKIYFPIIQHGISNSNIIRTLQLVNNSNFDSIVQVARINSVGSLAFKNKINLPANSYLILWQGCIFLPAGMGLYCYTDLNSENNVGIGVYASVLEQDGVTDVV